MSKQKPMTRRRFVGRVGAAAAQLGVVGLVTAPAIGRSLDANEKIILGVIGTGGRGRTLIQNANNSGQARVAAVCDVYPANLERGAEEAGEPVEKFVDYRRILDQKDIDAVTIATPEHQHAAPLFDALAAGKDV